MLQSLKPSLVLVLCFLTLWYTSIQVAGGEYRIGVGIADVTGSAVEVPMMGYGSSEQLTYGIHTRQFSRAFIIDDGSKRIVYAVVDVGMISDIITLKVVEELENIYGKEMYDYSNVCLTATHTHSGPGGYFQYVMYLISSIGFVDQTFTAIVDGIVESIEMAHDNIQPGRIFVNQGELKGANINRSPASYLRNPKSEREKYKADTDTLMTILKFTTLNLKPMGLISWFPVHCTSMNNSNGFISSDNKGLASLLFEQEMNAKDAKIGEGPFVAAFSQTNEGDVSPNLNGPICKNSGKQCDFNTSTCDTKGDECIASGPGKDMFESTWIIGNKQFDKAKELFSSDRDSRELKGPVNYSHQFVNMSNISIQISEEKWSKSGPLMNGAKTWHHYTLTTTVKTCRPAMGYAFAAGTTDGAGYFDFKQSSTSGNDFWNYVSSFLATPTNESIACQYPKPILADLWQMTFPYLWQQEITPVQLLRISDFFILPVSGEFTTMAGRRLVKSFTRSAHASGVTSPTVVLGGLANSYANYITTFEEYQQQRYEGASTMHGPHQLAAYIQIYEELAKSMLSNNDQEGSYSSPSDSFADHVSLQPPDLLSTNRRLSRLGAVWFDRAGTDRQFGQVLVDVKSLYYRGDEVIVRFVSANPRNNLRTGDTFLTVEIYDSQSESWKVLLTDANWETKFRWIRTSQIFATSEVEIAWKIAKDQKLGVYRICHFGDYKSMPYLGSIVPFAGASSNFTIDVPYEEEKTEKLKKTRAVVSSEEEKPAKIVSNKPNRSTSRHSMQVIGLLFSITATLYLTNNLFKFQS